MLPITHSWGLEIPRLITPNDSLASHVVDGSPQNPAWCGIHPSIHPIESAPTEWAVFRQQAPTYHPERENPEGRFPCPWKSDESVAASKAYHP